MKISRLKKSTPFLYAILISLLSFGLFYTYQTINSSHGSLINPVSPVLRPDTIPGRNAYAVDSTYRTLLTSADKFYSEKAYEKCLIELQKAQLIKPNDPTLKERITKLNGLITAQKQVFEASQKSVASGDAYFKNKDYLNAKSAYQQAVSQNPDDAVAKEKLRKTMDLLRSQKAQNILFDVAVAGADKLFQAGDYVKAQQEYENASKLLPGDPYPKSKINEIIKIQVDRQVKDEEYAKALQAADKFYASKNYQDALLDYKKANKIKPVEKYPQDKIGELTKLLADIKVRDEAYNKAITLADLSFKSVQYPEALKSYKDALVIKPEQAYPANKIKEIEGILARIASAQADYDKYITLADSFYIDKKYYKARENYLLAISSKPSESYPKEMVSKADKMLTGQEAAMAKSLEEQYTAAISNGDKLLADKSYDKAKLEYQTAIKIKSAEQYPRNKIAEIDKALTDLGLIKDREAKYTAAIANGDKLLSQKSYAPAKAEYATASSMKPQESYPKDKIAEIEAKLDALAKQKELDDKYAGIITSADKLLAAKTYDQARIEYENALKVKPEEKYPMDKIAAIDKTLADIAATKSIEENYRASISKADQYLNDKSYDLAKVEYTKASGIKPAEQYPKTKIGEIDATLAAIAKQKALEDAAIAKQKATEEATLALQKALEDAAIAKQKALDDSYAAAISNGDKLLADKSYDKAKLEYQAALKIKSAEQYPKDKISEIDKTVAELAQIKDRDAKYTAAITNGDKLLAQKSFAPAKAEYATASSVKPQESYPRDKIAEIDATLDAIAKQKELDDKYAGIIASADKLLSAKTYDQARAEYENALNVKPGEKYPTDKIASIDKTLADIAATKSLEENYNASITKADQYLTDKSYDLAKAEYSKATGLKPVEQYPKTKIGEIDATLAAIAKQKALEEAELARQKALEDAAIAKQKAIDDSYTAAISNGDKLLADKSYDKAKLEYQTALKVKSTEQYPKDKISEIDKTVAELAVIKDREEKYTAAIANGDKLLAQKSYTPAKAEYATASSLKPQESYPKDKIAEIEATLAALAKQKELEDKYAGIIASADKLLAAKTYDQARVEYGNALKVKPEEKYPAEKVSEIDKIIADIAASKKLEADYKAAIANADQLFASKSYEIAKTEYSNAAALKPAEQYPKIKIGEIDVILTGIARQKALDEDYRATISRADKLLADKSYDLAKVEYQKASGLKGAEQYPKTKIAEIEKALTEIARLKAIDDQYSTAISGADKLLQDKSYEQARTAYAEAAKIKTTEQYPKDKIMEINTILADIAKKKSIDDQYKTIIAKADQLLAAKSLELAKLEYINAGKLKPDDQYSKDKISEIEAILADIKAKEDAYKASISNADQLLAQKKYEESRTEYQNSLLIKPQATYPKEKIAEINKTLEDILGKQKYYENLIVEADNLLKDKDYVKAKETYQQALAVLPAQTYPKERINLITARVDSLYRANKSLYDKSISDGDRYYSSFEFDKAVDAYTDAANFLPMEKYPREMIVKIRRTIEENAIADVLKSTVTITSNTEKQFPFPPVNIASRKNNFVYIKIRNLSGKPFNILMRYGKDKQANGGVVMRNLSIDGKVNERLVSVRDQDLWYREDNNWISLYPQGGDVEVSFIQVSRAK